MTIDTWPEFLLAYGLWAAFVFAAGYTLWLLRPKEAPR